MKCQEHPKYTGKRKPRTDCKACLAFYEASNKPSELPKAPVKETKTKKSKSIKPVDKDIKVDKPVVTWADRQKKILEDYKGIAIVGRKPDRLLSRSPNQYRQELFVVLHELFPEYTIAINSDGTQVNMMSRDIAMYGTNTWKVGTRSSSIPGTSKAEVLANCRKEEISLKHGDIFFSEKMKTPIIIISYNEAQDMVMIKEWHSHELVLVPIKEFHKLELREVVADDDFERELNLKSKVLVY